MANATAITINDLVAATPIVLPTADVLDTGSSPVTLSAAVNSQDLRRVWIHVQNLDSGNALPFAVKAGATNPPAFRTGLGDLSVSVALSTTKVVGPFEPARFAQSDGSLQLVFSPLATINAKVTLYRLPKHT